MRKLGKAATVVGLAGLLVAAGVGMGIGPSASTAAGEAVSSAAMTASTAATYKIDAGHSGVLFRINHAKAGVFWGRFNELSGTYQIDPDDLESSFFRVTVPVASVDTNSEKRDQHLRSADFFNARQYPEATFASTSLVATDEPGVFQLNGDLTMFGVTKPITARLLYTGEGEFRGSKTKGFEAEFTIKREVFGNTTYLAPDGSNNGGLGNDVRIIVAGEGTAQ